MFVAMTYVQLIRSSKYYDVVLNCFSCAFYLFLPCNVAGYENL